MISNHSEFRADGGPAPDSADRSIVGRLARGATRVWRSPARVVGLALAGLITVLQPAPAEASWAGPLAVQTYPECPPATFHACYTFQLPVGSVTKTNPILHRRPHDEINRWIFTAKVLQLVYRTNLALMNLYLFNDDGVDIVAKLRPIDAPILTADDLTKVEQAIYNRTPLTKKMFSSNQVVSTHITLTYLVEGGDAGKPMVEYLQVGFRNKPWSDSATALKASRMFSNLAQAWNRDPSRAMWSVMPDQDEAVLISTPEKGDLKGNMVFDDRVMHPLGTIAPGMARQVANWTLGILGAVGAVGGIVLSGGTAAPLVAMMAFAAVETIGASGLAIFPPKTPDPNANDAYSYGQTIFEGIIDEDVKRLSRLEYKNQDLLKLQVLLVPLIKHSEVGMGGFATYREAQAIYRSYLFEQFGAVEGDLKASLNTVLTGVWTSYKTIAETIICEGKQMEYFLREKRCAPPPLPAAPVGTTASPVVTPTRG